MFKKVENHNCFKSNLLNYLFSEIAWNMDRLMRFEKTSKYVEAVDAHHFTCNT